MNLTRVTTEAPIRDREAQDTKKTESFWNGKTISIGVVTVAVLAGLAIIYFYSKSPVQQLDPCINDAATKRVKELLNTPFSQETDRVKELISALTPESCKGTKIAQDSACVMNWYIPKPLCRPTILDNLSEKESAQVKELMGSHLMQQKIAMRPLTEALTEVTTSLNGMLSSFDMELVKEELKESLKMDHFMLNRTANEFNRELQKINRIQDVRILNTTSFIPLTDIEICNFEPSSAQCLQALTNAAEFAVPREYCEGHNFEKTFGIEHFGRTGPYIPFETTLAAEKIAKMTTTNELVQKHYATFLTAYEKTISLFKAMCNL